MAATKIGFVKEKQMTEKDMVKILAAIFFRSKEKDSLPGSIRSREMRAKDAIYEAQRCLDIIGDELTEREERNARDRQT